VGNRIERLAEYPDITREPMGAALVRGVRADALGECVGE
jgi:hypothetical protein